MRDSQGAPDPHDLRDLIRAEPARDPEPETAGDRARREVLGRLRAHPQITRAFSTRWEAGALIVTLAVRDVGVCDLAIPRERIRDITDYAGLLALLGNPQGQGPGGHPNSPICGHLKFPHP